MLRMGLVYLIPRGDVSSFSLPSQSSFSGLLGVPLTPFSNSDLWLSVSFPPQLTLGRPVGSLPPESLVGK